MQVGRRKSFSLEAMAQVQRASMAYSPQPMATQLSPRVARVNFLPGQQVYTQPVIAGVVPMLPGQMVAVRSMPQSPRMMKVASEAT